MILQFFDNIPDLPDIPRPWIDIDEDLDDE